MITYQAIGATGWGPPVISWFINHYIIPMNTIVISTINQRIQPLIDGYKLRHHYKLRLIGSHYSHC